MILPVPLEVGSRVLIAGAGGGWDFACGLPIALELEKRGHYVAFANASFTNLALVTGGRWHLDNLLEIDADSWLAHGDCFPERLLSAWYRARRGRKVPVHCIGSGGVVPTVRAYEKIIEKERIDTILCIDGGVDGILRGDEFDLGTPSLDAISVMAASLCSAKTRIYAMTAFGIEGAETGLPHAQVLGRVSDLMREGAFLGVGALHGECGGVFMDAMDHMYQGLPAARQSVILNGIRSAARGDFGRVNIHAKTDVTRPWISPLASLWWYFSADNVARMKLYFDAVLDSETVAEVSEAIEALRSTVPIQPRETIPV